MTLQDELAIPLVFRAFVGGVVTEDQSRGREAGEEGRSDSGDAFERPMGINCADVELFEPR